MSLLLVNKTFMVLGIIERDIINDFLNFVTRSRTHSIRDLCVCVCVHCTLLRLAFATDSNQQKKKNLNSCNVYRRR